MSAIGISASWVPSAPSNSVINDATREHSVGVKTYRNPSGVTVEAIPEKVVETKITIKGKGTADFSSVIAHSAITSGTAVLVSATTDESSDDVPEFTHELMSWT